MSDPLFHLFIQYGQQQLSFKALQAAVKKHTNRTISPFIADDYWGYRDIDEVIAALLDDSIQDWGQFELEKTIEWTIKHYEDGTLDLETTQTKLFNATGKTISQYSLDNYWRSEDLGEFVQTIAIQALDDWEHINDERALQLIVAILEDTSTAIVWRNGTALEKRYSKPAGTVSDLIFWNDLTPAEILSVLKGD